MTRDDAIIFAKRYSNRYPDYIYAAYRCNNGQWVWGRVSENMARERESNTSIYRYGTPVLIKHGEPFKLPD